MYEGKEGYKEKGTDSRTEEEEKSSGQHNPVTKFEKNCIQDAVDHLKKGKAKDSSGVRAEQLKNCSDTTKEKSGRSSMKSHG